jgi:hypothetical protein
VIFFLLVATVFCTGIIECGICHENFDPTQEIHFEKLKHLRGYHLNCLLKCEKDPITRNSFTQADYIALIGNGHLSNILGYSNQDAYEAFKFLAIAVVGASGFALMVLLYGMNLTFLIVAMSVMYYAF